MLQLSDFLIDRQVLSLRAGNPVATALEPIINPDNLRIEGFFCIDRFEKKKLILLCQDIREIIRNGFVVDDIERLVEAEELVRLKDIIDLHYELRGKPVETLAKEKVGKVTDYAIETNSMMIQKLYVSQSIFKNFTGGSLSIDRNQVHEVTPRRIIITELMKGSPATAASIA